MPLLILLLAAGVVELSVLILVGQVIGVLPTIGLLIAGALIGSWLLRREGRRTLREINEAARLRRPPTREFADGALIAFGGILIVLPGFVSDLAGLLCLLPPTRAILRRRLERSAERRAQAVQEQMRAHAAYGTNAGQWGAERRGPERRAAGDVIDGEVVSVSEDDDDGQVSPELPPQARRPSDGADG